MVRTLDAALELIRIRGLITEVPSPGILSLAEAVIGGPVAGGVWQHAKGNLIFRIGKGLRASPEVLAVRLWDGKMTFVDRRLWPEVYRVAMEPRRRRAALLGLSYSGRALLERVEREGLVRMSQHDWVKERETLEVRLLVQSSDVFFEEKYWSRLQSWRSWAAESTAAIAASITYSDALHALASPTGEAPVGPWVSAEL